jgi:hypothetical protein
VHDAAASRPFGAPTDCALDVRERTLASRANPARASPRSPRHVRIPRNASVREPCSRRESPPIPAQPGSAMTDLSRRRSRVRVPSLPSLEVPANRHGCCPVRRSSRCFGGPNAGADRKIPANRHFFAVFVDGRTKRPCHRAAGGLGFVGTKRPAPKSRFFRPHFTRSIAENESGITRTPRRHLSTAALGRVLSHVERVVRVIRRARGTPASPEAGHWA